MHFNNIFFPFFNQILPESHACSITQHFINSLALQCFKKALRVQRINNVFARFTLYGINFRKARKTLPRNFNRNVLFSLALIYVEELHVVATFFSLFNLSRTYVRHKQIFRVYIFFFFWGD